jgi:hypothetical protein
MHRASNLGGVRHRFQKNVFSESHTSSRLIRMACGASRRGVPAADRNNDRLRLQCPFVAQEKSDAPE